VSEEQGYPTHVPVVRKRHPMLPGPEIETVCARCGEDWPCGLNREQERSKAQAAIIAGLRYAISSALCLVAEGPEVMRSAALRDEVEKVLLSTLKMGDAAALEQSK
jgi:hypothetical protein